MTIPNGTFFGETSEGSPVRAFDISGDGLSARMIEWGAVLQDLRLDGVDRPLTLGFPTMEGYLADGQHIGAVVGRVANRLSGGRFSVNGVPGLATRNIGGRDTLHGGAHGWGRRLWRAVEGDGRRVVLRLDDPDGAEGFPGAVAAECAYEIAGGALRITMTAAASAPTIVNATHHAYFNLTGENAVDDHEIAIFADRLTPLNERLMPTGAVEAVARASDLRAMSRLGRRVIDVNYVLSDTRRDAPEEAARLRGGGVDMRLSATAPGLQVYTGDNLTGAFAPRAGLCLEPQYWPDAPNHPCFPSIEIGPDRPYREVIELAFART